MLSRDQVASAASSSSSRSARARTPSVLLREFDLADEDEELHGAMERMRARGQVQLRSDDADRDFDDPADELEFVDPEAYESEDPSSENEEDEVDAVEEPKQPPKKRRKRKAKAPSERHDEATDAAKRAREEKGFVNVNHSAEFDRARGAADKPVEEEGHRLKNARSASTPFEFLQIFFTNILTNSMLQETNAYLNTHPACRKDKTLTEITISDLYGFFAVYFAFCLVNYRHIRDAWTMDPEHLLGNDFIASVMSRDRFETIYRCIGSSSKDITSQFNVAAKMEWHLGSSVCFDDQLERYLGNGAIKYIPTKACRMGIASWQVVDSKTYCWHAVWEDDFSDSKKRGEPVGEQLVRALTATLSRNRRFFIVIDAGPMGSFDTAEHLLKHHHHFIISCAANRPSWLFAQHLHHFDIPINSVATVHNNSMIAITYQSKKARKAATKEKKGKKVNFLTNVANLLNQNITAEHTGNDRTHSHQTKKPKLIILYNQYHGYCDQLKSIITQFDHEHRCSRRERHKFFAIMRLIIHNTYLLMTSNTSDTQYTRHRFLNDLVKQLKTAAKPPAPTPLAPKPDLSKHILRSHGRAERGACVVCGKRVVMVCAGCDPAPYLCSGAGTNCILLHHQHFFLNFKTL